jgi:hypothetical protein
VIDAFAKEYLHADLREVRAVLVWKLDGLSEYDARRPLTSSGTNLLGLIKHLSMSESRYFGEVFGRPFPERLPWWDEDADDGADMWATEDETRAGPEGAAAQDKPAAFWQDRFDTIERAARAAAGPTAS